MSTPIDGSYLNAYFMKVDKWAFFITPLNPFINTGVFDASLKPNFLAEE
jgi:hypothetical protein